MRKDKTDKSFALSVGSFDTNKIADLKTAVRAFMHPIRMKMLKIMDSPNGVSVGELTKKIGEIQPVTSMHLTMLRKANLVTHSRSGKKKLYKINTDRLKSLIEASDALKAPQES